MAVVTGEAEPRAGSYRGEPAVRGGRLLELADRGQVVVDDATAAAIGDRLPPEIGLAELPAERDRPGCSSLPGWPSRREPEPAPIAD